MSDGVYRIDSLVKPVGLGRLFYRLSFVLEGYSSPKCSSSPPCPPPRYPIGLTFDGRTCVICGSLRVTRFCP
nr:MAG TPA: hypothetical protein [Caudoviricetes sp.]